MPSQAPWVVPGITSWNVKKDFPDTVGRGTRYISAGNVWVHDFETRVNKGNLEAFRRAARRRGCRAGNVGATTLSHADAVGDYVTRSGIHGMIHFDIAVFL
jgi:hypothetical protein